MSEIYDAIIIGGGFYGATIAAYLKGSMDRVLILEKEAGLLSRASYVNQARVHGGYHYPRSLNTAYRSRVNFRHFYREFGDAVFDNFRSVYCVARNNSKVTPRHFFTFCNQIGAPIKPASGKIRKLFPERMISEVYETQESSFNAAVLREILAERLARLEVELRLNTMVGKIVPSAAGSDTRLAEVHIETGEVLRANHVFNCTYSGLNHVLDSRWNSKVKLKHEISEVALVQVPAEFEEMGITVMDGPFFSLFPFPDKKLHSFTHVRYTPHTAWEETGVSATSPYRIFSEYEKKSKYRYMLNDARRFIPLLDQLKYSESLFEVKTVLTSSEIDDGRPILFEAADKNENVVSILGSKIDNVFDVLKVVDSHLGIRPHRKITNAKI